MEYSKWLRDWCEQRFENVTNDEHREMFMTLVDELDRLVKLFESLTPSGSEFAGDADACYSFVKDRLHTVMEVAKERNELRSELARLQSEARWISVGEDLPIDSMPVLIRIRGYVYPKIAHHTDAIKQWASTDGMFWHDISYDQVESWKRLLPTPPTEG